MPVLRLLATLVAALVAAGGVARAGGNLQIRHPDNPAQIVPVRWDARRQPIHWALSQDGLPGSGIDNPTLRTEVQAGFVAWDALPTADVAFVFDGEVDARDGRANGPFGPGVDGRNLVTFTDPDFVFDDGVLAVTLTTFMTAETVVTAANADLDGDGTA